MRAYLISILILLAAALVVLGGTGTMADGQENLVVADSGLGAVFHQGDTATGYMVLSNSGERTIQTVTVTVTIYPDAALGFPAAYKKQDFKVDLAPGETKRIEFSQKIPAKLMGISTIGHYNLNVKVEADGSYASTLEHSVDIV